MENSNNLLKQAINQLGVNLSENAVIRISKAEALMRSVMDNIDRDVNRMARSGKQKKKSSDTDMDVLVRKLREEVQEEVTCTSKMLKGIQFLGLICLIYIMDK